jgi:hypothetical protein
VRCGPAGEGAGAMGPLVAFRVGLSRRGDVARGLRPTTTKQGCAAHATESAGNTLSRRTMPRLSCGNDVDCMTWSTYVRR